MTDASLILKSGKQLSLHRTYTVTPTISAPQQFKVGINQVDLTTLSSDLTNPVPIQGTESVDDCEETTGWTAGTDSVVSVNSTRFKEGAASLSLEKNGTSGTTMSMSKTVTSLDFTDKTVNSWVYIEDLTDFVSSGTALTIRYGDDSSNYYYLDVDVSDLAAGWNYVYFDSSTATGTTGSPTTASTDYYEIIFNVDLATDTISADRVLLDSINIASTDDYVEDFVSGYPIIDNTNLEVTTRCYLDSLQANGFDVDSLIVLNKDGTPVPFSMDKFSPESKGNTDEFGFILVDRTL